MITIFTNDPKPSFVGKESLHRIDARPIYGEDWCWVLVSGPFGCRENAGKGEKLKVWRVCKCN